MRKAQGRAMRRDDSSLFRLGQGGGQPDRTGGELLGQSVALGLETGQGGAFLFHLPGHLNRRDRRPRLAKRAGGGFV